MKITIELEMPEGMRGLQLPAGVQHRLQHLLASKTLMDHYPLRKKKKPKGWSIWRNF